MSLIGDISIAILVYLLYVLVFGIFARHFQWGYVELEELTWRIISKVQAPHILFRFIVPLIWDKFILHQNMTETSLDYYVQNIICNSCLLILLIGTWVFAYKNR